MKEKEIIRISSWSINVDVLANVSTIHLKGRELKEVKNFILREIRIPEECIKYVITILNLAEECNSDLLEVCSYSKPNVLRFSFEFKFREEFLKFEKEIKELSL